MIKLYITNLGKYNEGILTYGELRVPYGEDELLEVLDEIGINEEYEEYFISDYESDLNINIGEYTNISNLNYQIDYIFSLTEDIELINGIIEHHTNNLDDIISILSNGNYTTLDMVRSYYDIGYTIAEDIYNIDTSSYINSFIDYESLGKDSNFNLIDGDRALEIY